MAKKLQGSTRKRAISEKKGPEGGYDDNAKPTFVRKSLPTVNLESLMSWDVALVLVLLVLSALTRFYRIGHPAAVVFDEFHFYKFVAMYRKREHLFDIHPPLGKLILTLGGWLGGFNPDFDPSNIGKLYPSAEYYVPIRRTAALFGTVSVPITYMISRELSMSQPVAFTSAFMILVDMLNLIESRLVLIDSQVITFSQMALLCALVLWKQPPKSRSRLVMLVVTGFVAGCALAIKWTTLATPGTIAIVSFFGCFLPRSRLSIAECIIAGASGLFIYALSFYLHFKLSVYSGEGDPFMPRSFRETLIGSPLYKKETQRKSFLDLFVYLNKEMLRANSSIKTRHPWESKWFEWPLDLRGILYYTGTSDKKEVKMYLIGNPVVFLVCLVGTATFMVMLLYHLNNIRVETKTNTRNVLDATRVVLPHAWFGPALVLLGTYWLNLLPYILVERAAFLYHYIPGLFYALLLTCLVIDRLPVRVRNTLCFIICVGSLAAFMYWLPWVYATPLTSAQQAARELLPRWN